MIKNQINPNRPSAFPEDADQHLQGQAAAESALIESWTKPTFAGRRPSAIAA